MIYKTDAKLKEAWIGWVIDLACRRNDSWMDGARKIFHHQSLELKTLDPSLTIEDSGFTQYKLTKLASSYLVKESIDTAMWLHERNIKRKKYASAGFHCYNHLLKNDPEKKSTHASVMGPCLQSVIITLHPREGRTSVTVYYRTTEAAKKFPADLVFLRDYILPSIPGQDRYPVVGWRFDFANVTAHPMYMPALFPHLPDPAATLDRIRHCDPVFWEWVGKWSSRYLIGGAAMRGIEKHAQSMRTADAACALLRGTEAGRDVVSYLHRNRRAFLPTRSRFEQSSLLDAYDQALVTWGCSAE